MEGFEYLDDFGDSPVPGTSTCLRCGALVPNDGHCIKMTDYDDPREKHYNWHRRVR